ncbi:hypothetical protein BEN47_17785 [Hymenobacter lapidarius]|uniref:Uncharacterized protein n=2 Tax=Hymenobacter lapidarius TaxID=1908237 RepID=A0A1G1SX68_9BACT|nr:hypothetical protein BEN47_17785 [Hymenobacter lapidarius]
MGKGWKEYLTNLYRDSAAIVTSVRDISDIETLNLRNAEQQNDLDAAYMSNVFFGDSINFLLYSLLERIDKFSIKDGVKIYLSLQKEQQRMSLKQLLHFIKNKINHRYK